MPILLNAAQVLKCFSAECSDLTVSDVAARLSMPKANASRLLKAMRGAGLLETIGETKRHRPGRLLLDLAAAYRGSSPLIKRAGEVLAEVNRSFGHTGYVTVRDGREVTAVLDCPGTNALRVVSSIGRRLPAHLSATGRTLLARLGDAEVRRIYDGHPAAAALPAILADVRRRGFAHSSQETTAGVDAIAVAVGDPATAELVSLCVVYPSAVVAAADRDAMIHALIGGAARIAVALGDTGFVRTDVEGKETPE